MKPTIGRIVLYRIPEGGKPFEGLQSNGLKPGDLLPAMVVRVWNPPDSDHADLVNLQVFTDCGGTVSATSVHEGETNGTWSWPPRA